MYVKTDMYVKTNIMLTIKNLTEVCPNGEWSQDIRYYERVFNGKLTERRLTFFDYYCKENTWKRSCCCLHDCCGHCFSQQVNYNIIDDNLILTVIRYYNY
jgi:hypothetical protein